MNSRIAAGWARAREILAEAQNCAGPLIPVGGTGLYFRALTEGLSDIPRAPKAVRAQVRAAGGGRTDAVRCILALAARRPAHRRAPQAERPPAPAAARSVVAATGRPLAEFHAARQAPALPAEAWAGLFLAPEREALNVRIEARFDEMLREGALDEVAALATRQLDPDLPAMRAHGVPHLIAHLEGRLSLDEARARSPFATPAATPSASSPGRATRCRISPGSRRRRRGGGGGGARLKRLPPPLLRQAIQPIGRVVGPRDDAGGEGDRRRIGLGRAALRLIGFGSDVASNADLRASS